jgi:hypothetical protein
MMGVSAIDRLGNEMKHGRVHRIHFGRELGMTAIHRQRVLRKVVCADGEEVGLACKRVRHDRHARHFHHDAAVDRSYAERFRFFRQYRFRIAKLLDRRNHRKHHDDATGG